MRRHAHALALALALLTLAPPAVAQKQPAVKEIIAILKLVQQCAVVRAGTGQRDQEHRVHQAPRTPKTGSGG